MGDCALCGRRGNGVRQWGIVMPQGTVSNLVLCSTHSEPLRKLVAKGLRERKTIGVAGLDDLVDPDL